MGVYIPDGQKPKTCWHCWAEDGGHCHAGKPKRIRDIDDYVIARTRHPNCPLVEIPTPHGRLIDENDIKEGYIPFTGTVSAQAIIDAPTVIEEEL